MTTEQSHGKARTIMVRASDLRTSETVEKPTDPRAAHGHFAAGNRTAIGARFKATIKRALGTKGSTGDQRAVYRDALRIFSHTLRELPSDAAPVRTLVALHARHVALNGFFTSKAEASGLDTLAGQRLLEIADRQSQRAERVLVTALDVARVCAASRVDSGNGMSPNEALRLALDAEARANKVPTR